MTFRPMRQLLSFALASGALGCTSGVPTQPVEGKVYSYLVQFNHSPTPGDSAAAARLGGTSIFRVPLADALLLQATDNGYEFRDLPDCRYVLIINDAEQSGMVDISYSNRVTPSELALIDSLAKGPPTQDSLGTTVSAWIGYKAINRLQGDPNVVSAAINPHFYFPM